MSAQHRPSVGARFFELLSRAAGSIFSLIALETVSPSPIRAGGGSRARHAAENQAARPIRDHGTDARRCLGLDRAKRLDRRRLSLSESDPVLTPHLSTRQYARVLKFWLAEIGLDPRAYGTHSLRRTRASLIYRRTKNLRAVQWLLGHTNIASTVRYLGIEVDDALELAEQTEI